MKEERMVKSAGVFDTTAKVIGGITKAAAIVCAVFAILVLIFGNKMFTEGALTLDLDFVKLHLAEGFEVNSTMLKIYTCVSIAVGGAVCYAVSLGCGIVRRLLAPMKEGRPFAEDAPANIRKMAWLVFAGGAAMEVLGIVARVLIAAAYPIESVFAESVEHIEYVFTMNFGFVIVFCALMLLSYIFAYGQALQKESDETL